MLALNKKKGDKWILVIVIFLALFGVLMIYSASKYTAEKDLNNKYYYATKQLIGFLVGLVFMIFTSFFDYRKYKKLYIILPIISAVLLALVFTPVGQESYGAKRWIKIGSLTIQPSEIAKFSFVLFCSVYLGNKPERATDFLGILPVLSVGGIFCLLIMLEPNMSITVCFGILMLVMIYLGGMKKKFFYIIAIPLLLAVPLLIILEPYRMKRLSAFINPWNSPKGEGYQLIQSLYALGSGGWFGVGLFNSRQKYKFLPFSESDFILSVIGEEFGFVGVILLFTIIFILIIKGIKIASKSRDFYSFLLSSGIVCVFFVQVVVNALVVTGSIPPTGLPLPLISCGNTSLIVFMGAFGVLYNVSKNSDELTIYS